MKMDLFLLRRFNSFLLIPRIVTISPKLPLFLCRRSQVTSCESLQYLEKKQCTIYRTSNLKFLNKHYDRVFDSGVRSCTPSIRIFHCSAFSRLDSSTKSEIPNKDCYRPPVIEKPSVFQRMKQMTKDYWHILIPVHIITSIGWVSMFYIAAKNGVDVVRLLESLNLSDKYVEMLRGSNAGNWAITYALYKVFTPFRYTVTLGGTTMCIRYLKKWGYLKIKQSQMAHSIQCAKEHKKKYANSDISNKMKIKRDQPQSQKT